MGVLAAHPASVVPGEPGGVASGSRAAGSAGPGERSALAASDLAEILARFNQASEALQQTHETLQGEVARLTRELEEANEELQRSRRLAALGEMAAGIAHEVRNPLASIALDARMLEADAGDRHEARSAAERIGISVRGLNRVVGDVLCFARELSPRVEPVAADDLLLRAQAECGPLACAAGVSIECEAIAGEVLLRCDSELAHRAITNLVRNAIEAIAERGREGAERRVLLSAARRAGRSRSDGVVSVRDTGPGIDASVIDRMFNPFFTTRAAGTGLGLAIVHRIMDAHGGRVEVRASGSAEAGRSGAGDGRVGARASSGGGATFELLFPEHTARARARRTPMEKDR